ncbi:MAG: hypothetical protein NT091_05080 [Candidatus Falkowbacteria bacterium]|nr:hypothetical protein [Candidatus Falkowbacteria bacterium]
MFSKYKKLFLSIGLLLVSLIIGYFIYALFFKKTIIPTEPLPGESTGKPSGLPIAQEGTQKPVQPATSTKLKVESVPFKPSEIATGGVTQVNSITNHPTIGAKMSSTGTNLNYYDKTDGKFYTVGKGGQIKTLSDKQFFDVQDVTWSPTKEKAILEYPDGANIIYDFATNKQVTMPAHWENFDFSPAGDKIAMKSLGLDPDNRWLAMVNEDGTSAKKIEPIGTNADNIHVSWSPNDQIVGYEIQGIDAERQEIFFIGKNKENFKSMTVNGRGLEAKWNPAGDKLLYSTYSSVSDNKPTIWSANASGEAIGSDRKRLNIETWASKCTFDNPKELLCAVPNELPSGAGMIPSLADSTIDSFYQIDTETGFKKLIAVPENNLSASNLVVSKDGESLYFTNNITGALEQIKLK